MPHLLLQRARHQAFQAQVCGVAQQRQAVEGGRQRRHQGNAAQQSGACRWGRAPMGAGWALRHECICGLGFVGSARLPCAAQPYLRPARCARAAEQVPPRRQPHLVDTSTSAAASSSTRRCSSAVVAMKNWRRASRRAMPGFERKPSGATAVSPAAPGGSGGGGGGPAAAACARRRWLQDRLVIAGWAAGG